MRSPITHEATMTMTDDVDKYGDQVEIDSDATGYKARTHLWVCRCGSTEFNVFSHFSEYETTIQCHSCNRTAVVHTG